MQRYLFALLLITLSNSAKAQEFVAISKGDKQICGITATQQLLCTTASSAERLEPPATLPSLIDVEVGESHACGLDVNGSIVCWGDNNFGQLNSPAGQGYVALSVGWNHSCAIDDTSKAICWGLTDSGRLEVPSNLGPIVQVEASLENTCVLDLVGDAYCFGSDSLSISGENIVKMGVSASPQNSIVQVCLLNQSGDIECGQFDFDGSYTDIAGWGSAMCALTSAGKIECQLRFSPEDITEENLTEIDRLNNDFNFVALHGGQGLCATTDTAQTVCASAANLPARIGSPLSDRLPLPGIQPDQPGAVDDLSVNVYSDTTAELLWSYIGKGGDGRVTGVQIYRNGALLIEIDQLSSYLDTSLTPGIDYRYQVSIVNSRGDVGPLGNAITINTSNRNNTGEIPTVPNVARANPTGLQALQYGDTVFELVWDRSNLNVIGYEVYRNHVLLGFTNGISFFDDTATDMHIHYDILAIGTDGQILGFGGVSAR